MRNSPAPAKRWAPATKHRGGFERAGQLGAGVGRHQSAQALPHLGGRRKKSINEVAECVPVGELVITLRARIAATLHDDEFDELFLEVIVFGEAPTRRSEKQDDGLVPPTPETKRSTYF